MAFGGELTLSGASQRSESSVTGGSGRVGSREDADESGSDGSDDVVVLSGQHRTTALPHQHVAAGTASPPGSYSRQSNARRYRRDGCLHGDDGDGGDGRKECTGGGKKSSVRDTTTGRRTVAPSLEAFERLISGQDFCMDFSPTPPSPPPTHDRPGSSNGSKCLGTSECNALTDGKAGSSGRCSVEGGGSDSGEIAYTLVRRTRRRSDALSTPVGTALRTAAASKAASSAATPACRRNRWRVLSDSSSDGDSDSDSGGGSGDCRSDGQSGD